MRSSSEPRELRFLEKKRTWIRVSDWDEHREFILGLVESKKSQPDILQILGQAGISMKRHQLTNLLKAWGVSGRNLKQNERSYIYSTYHRRVREGKRSAFRFSDTKDDVGKSQIERVIRSSGVEGPSDSTDITFCNTIEVYTPKDGNGEPEEESNIDNPEPSTEPPPPPSHPDNDMSWFFDLDGAGDAPGESSQSFPGDLSTLASTLSPLDPLLVSRIVSTGNGTLRDPSVELPSDSNEFMKTCQGIFDTITNAPIHPGDVLDLQPESLADCWYRPNPRYQKDLERWIADETNLALKTASQVEALVLELGIGPEEAAALWAQRSELMTGQSSRTYKLCLNVQNTKPGFWSDGAANKTYLLDWTGVFEVYAKYYEEIEAFAQKYYFKISFGMRVAHLPYIYARYGPSHWFTIRSAYAFNQILRHITSDPDELIPVSEVIVFGMGSLGLEKQFQGFRSILRLIELYHLVGRHEDANTLSESSSLDQFTEIDRKMGVIQDQFASIMIYLEPGGKRYSPDKAKELLSYTYNLQWPMVSDPSLPSKWRVALQDHLQQLGRGYLYLNQPAKALQIFHQSLKVIPEGVSSFGISFGYFAYGIQNMGEALFKMKNYTSALRKFQASVEWHVDKFGLGHQDTVRVIEWAVKVMHERGAMMYVAPILEGLQKVKKDGADEEEQKRRKDTLDSASSTELVPWKTVQPQLVW